MRRKVWLSPGWGRFWLNQSRAKLIRLPHQHGGWERTGERGLGGGSVMRSQPPYPHLAIAPLCISRFPKNVQVCKPAALSPWQRSVPTMEMWHVVGLVLNVVVSPLWILGQAVGFQISASHWWHSSLSQKHHLCSLKHRIWTKIKA